MAKLNIPPVKKEAPAQDAIEKVVMDSINKYQSTYGLDLRSQEVRAIAGDMGRDVSKAFAYYAQKFDIPEKEIRNTVTQLLDEWDRSGQPPQRVFAEVRERIRKVRPEEFREYQASAVVNARKTDKEVAELMKQGLSAEEALFRIAYHEVHEEQRKKMPAIYSTAEVFGTEGEGKVAKREEPEIQKAKKIEYVIEDSKEKHKRLRSELSHETDTSERSRLKREIMANLDETIRAIEASGQEEKYRKELAQLREAKEKPIYGGTVVAVQEAPAPREKTRAEIRAEKKRTAAEAEAKMRAEARAEREQRQAQKRADDEAERSARGAKKAGSASREELAQRLAESAMKKIMGGSSSAEVQDVLSGGRSVEAPPAVAAESPKKREDAPKPAPAERRKPREDVAEIGQIRLGGGDLDVRTAAPVERGQVAAKKTKGEIGVAEITPLEVAGLAINAMHVNVPNWRENAGNSVENFARGYLQLDEKEKKEFTRTLNKDLMGRFRAGESLPYGNTAQLMERLREEDVTLYLRQKGILGKEETL